MVRGSDLGAISVCAPARTAHALQLSVLSLWVSSPQTGASQGRRAGAETSLCSLALSPAPALWSAVDGGCARRSGCGPAVLSHLPPRTEEPAHLGGLDCRGQQGPTPDLQDRCAWDVIHTFEKIDDSLSGFLIFFVGTS